MGLTDVFTRKFTEMGGKIVGTEAYSKGDTDFRAQLTALKKLQAARPSTCPATTPTSGSSPARRASWASRCRCWAATAGTPSKLFELGGSAIEGSYFSNHYSPDDPTPRVQKFIADVQGGLRRRCRTRSRRSATTRPRVAIDAHEARAGLSTARPSATRSPRPRTSRAWPAPSPWTRTATPVKPAVVLQVGDGKTKYVATVNPVSMARAFIQHLINGLAAGHHLRARRARLHDGLRRAEAHQLRPRRRDDGGRLHGLRHRARARARARAASFVGVLLVFLVAMAGCALLGFLIERFAYRPLREKPRLTALITAIGISFALSYGFQLDIGPRCPARRPRALPGDHQARRVAHPRRPRRWSSGTGRCISLAHRRGADGGRCSTWCSGRASAGRCARCPSTTASAALMGIPADRVIARARSCSARRWRRARASSTPSRTPSVQPLMGLYVGLKAFVAAVIGGIGNVPGAVVGALLLGLVEEFVVGYTAVHAGVTRWPSASSSSCCWSGPRACSAASRRRRSDAWTPRSVRERAPPSRPRCAASLPVLVALPVLAVLELAVRRARRSSSTRVARGGEHHPRGVAQHRERDDRPVLHRPRRASWRWARTSPA